MRSLFFLACFCHHTMSLLCFNMLLPCAAVTHIHKDVDPKEVISCLLRFRKAVGDIDDKTWKAEEVRSECADAWGASANYGPERISFDVVKVCTLGCDFNSLNKCKVCILLRIIKWLMVSFTVYRPRRDRGCFRWVSKPHPNLHKHMAVHTNSLFSYSCSKRRLGFF